MRILVVGTVPPPGGERGIALGKVAAALLSAGDEVEVLSPDPRSAAHRHARLSGLWLPFELALRARRFDALVLSVEPGLPFPERVGRLDRAVTLAATGLALRLYREVTVRLASPVPIPGGVGGRATSWLWQKPSRIVCADPTDVALFSPVPGLAPGKVEVEPPSAEPAAAAPPAPLAEGAGREEALDFIRRRAEARRRATSGRREAGAGALPLASSAFSERAAPIELRPLARFVLGRLFAKLGGRAS